MGSKVQHRGGAAQNKPEDTTARKLMGSKALHRGKAAHTKSENITEGKEAAHSPHSKWRRKLFYEECNTKNISVNAGYINDSCK